MLDKQIISCYYSSTNAEHKKYFKRKMKQVQEKRLTCFRRSSIMKMYKVVAKCPKCGGEVIERKSKNGKIFYGCKGYPNCDFISWEIPLEEKCPKCNSYMTQKEIYGRPRKKCSNERCGYVESNKKNKTEENEETNS